MKRNTATLLCTALSIVICCRPADAAAAALLLAGPFGRGNHNGGGNNSNNVNQKGSGQQEYHASMNSNDPALATIPDIDFSTSCQDSGDDDEEYGVVNANIVKWQKVRIIQDANNGGKLRTVPTFLPGQTIASQYRSTPRQDELRPFQQSTDCNRVGTCSSLLTVPAKFLLSLVGTCTHFLMSIFPLLESAVKCKGNRVIFSTSLHTNLDCRNTI
mmetsp:Transcript_9983/g.11972  ORF Transcript_9983/g.11972 Transcript_9983/m.11972 type:complete len:215 (-) Transcript_9983:27-671(-)